MYIFLSITSWLEQAMLPCLFKVVFHAECPGCGFQRSVLLLLQGRVRDSWQLYPPAIPILLLLLFTFLHLCLKFTSGAKLIQYGYIFIAFFVAINYIYRIIH